jgi:hypothetical protein
MSYPKREYRLYDGFSNSPEKPWDENSQEMIESQLNDLGNEHYELCSEQLLHCTDNRWEYWLYQVNSGLIQLPELDPNEFFANWKDVDDYIASQFDEKARQGFEYVFTKVGYYRSSREPETSLPESDVKLHVFKRSVEIVNVDVPVKQIKKHGKAQVGKKLSDACQSLF